MILLLYFLKTQNNIMIPLSYYLILSAIVFAIGLAGVVVNRRNLIILLMCVELLLLAVNINFLALAHYFNDSSGILLKLVVVTAWFCYTVFPASTNFFVARYRN